MDPLDTSIRQLATEVAFSGVVRVDRAGRTAFAQAFGDAHRGHRIATTIATRFATASATKGLTALTIVSLIEAGHLTPATTARSLLRDDLPLIDDAVTVEQLLAHRSGIGDYFDEDDEDVPITAYLLGVPPHELATTEDYLTVLDGHPTKFAPGERFSYCNGGYVVLALLAERATGTAFARLVQERVCAPAGMRDTAFLRSDELPGDAATGYLAVDGLRTNVFHLPVLGSGDGGIFTTVADVHALWEAFLAGRVVSPTWVATMIAPRSHAPADPRRYGLGFWLHATSDAVILEGYDAGVSFRSICDPQAGITHTVISNTSEGAWPMTKHLDAQLGL